MTEPVSAVTAALEQALTGVVRGRLARWRALRLSVRRCEESLGRALIVIGRPADAWERLAEDCELLRASVHLFRKPRTDLVNLLERLRYCIDKKKLDMRDNLLRAALAKLDHDLSSLACGGLYMVTGSLPRVMPTYFDLHEDEGVVFRPGRWRKAIKKWGDRDDSLMAPKPWKE